MSIQLTNFGSGDTVNYSLPLLSGFAQPAFPQSFISVQNTSVHTSTPQPWPVQNGCFKALVPLQKGQNSISLKYFEEVVEIQLYFEVPTRVYFVRPVLICCQNDDGSIQGPGHEDLSKASALRRISLGAKLLQTFTAEKLNDHGFSRKTFALECDVNPHAPECHVFTSKLTVPEAHAMSGGDLWMHFAKELMTSNLFCNSEHCKWLAYMSFTRYKVDGSNIPKTHSEILNATKGHTALGGGGLALYGSGSIHCWAENLSELNFRLTDTTRIDRSQLMDDSAYRETHWANFSTSLGASLHELGHTFDLAHTPTGVMARGFDDLYRVFLVQSMSRSGWSSADGSRLASPVPYSPRQSPIRRAKPKSSSRSSSPKACPLSRPNIRSLSPSSFSSDYPQVTAPAMIQIETAFKKFHLQNTQRMLMENYDGSVTTKAITRHRDGVETLTEITRKVNGEKTLRETVRHLMSGKTRVTMSLSTQEFSCLSHSSSCHGDVSTSIQGNNNNNMILSKHQTHRPASLPESPETDVILSRQYSDVKCRKEQYTGDLGGASMPAFHSKRYLDGGAHWYRSSAVLLAYHRWFNDTLPDDHIKKPFLQNGEIHSVGGLRLVELRSLPDGVVLHHWEFLHDFPPILFPLNRPDIPKICENAKEIGILAEDSYGNIFKKKLAVSQLVKPECLKPGKPM